MEHLKVKTEIDRLRNELNRLIGSEAGEEEVYAVSVRLDALIADYIRRTNGK